MRKTSARDRIVDAAERLFAERGIEAVSLREIGAAAGQRNNSAVQYHFGSKRALVEAIFQVRMPPIDRRIHELLGSFEQEGREPTLRETVQAIVWPLADQLDGTHGGRHYLRFIGQVEADPRPWVIETFHGRLDRAFERAVRGLLRELAGLPLPLRIQRVTNALRYVVRALARREHDVAREISADLPLPAFVANLVDELVAMLEAKASESTKAELRTLASLRA